MANLKIDFSGWLGNFNAMPLDKRMSILAMIMGILLILIAIISW